MRLVVISDTHGLQRLPGGHIVMHAGDFMNVGYDPAEILSFNRWLGEQSFEHRVVCAGKHDRCFHLTDHFDACRRKRNEIDHTGATIATGTEAEELLLHARSFIQVVERWIEANHPAFRR